MGIADEDTYCAGTDFDDIFGKLRRVDNPEIGAFISFNYNQHSGVVTSTEPLAMTHRTGYQGRVVENQLVSTLSDHYGDGRFYV